MDTYITELVMLPCGDDMKVGKVIKRSVDYNAIRKGKAHSNPILDSRKYLVEFGDGEVLEYSANVIAKNLYAQVDSEVKCYLFMDSTIDHNKDHNAVLKDNEFESANVNVRSQWLVGASISNGKMEPQAGNH
jgi:hypothetical protein